MGNDKEKEGERGGRGVGKVGKKGLVDVSGGSSSGGRIRLVIYPTITTLPVYQASAEALHALSLVGRAVSCSR